MSVILWLILGAITLAVVAALLRPLLAAAKPDLPRAAYDLQVYRDQLAEVTRDQSRGVLAPTEAEAATREIQRRALATTSEETAPPTELPGRTARRWTALGIAAAVPIAAFAIYLAVGFPNAPDAPFAERERAAKASAGKMPDINTALQRLEGELKTNPNDLSGWLLLARSYQALGRDGDAVGAYRHAAELKPDTPEIVAAYAEAMVMADNGAVTPEAKKLFERVVTQDPKSLPARFYLGLARAQAGDGTGAVRAWLAIEAEAPKDAPWLPALQAQIEKTATEFGLDPTKLAPALAAPVPAK